MIAAMCEQFVARAAEPFRLDELWPLVERMERYGIAGFGWGVTWLGGDGARTGRRPSDVYGNAGRPCPRCGTLIRSETYGSGLPRIAYWCPVCQPDPRKELR